MSFRRLSSYDAALSDKDPSRKEDWAVMIRFLWNISIECFHGIFPWKAVTAVFYGWKECLAAGDDQKRCKWIVMLSTILLCERGVILLAIYLLTDKSERKKYE